MVLTRLNAESYLGVPLWGSTREVVGHMKKLGVTRPDREMS